MIIGPDTPTSEHIIFIFFKVRYVVSTCKQDGRILRVIEILGKGMICTPWCEYLLSDIPNLDFTLTMLIHFFVLAIIYRHETSCAWSPPRAFRRIEILDLTEGCYLWHLVLGYPFYEPHNHHRHIKKHRFAPC